MAGDTNSVRDVFVRDRQLGTTSRVSVGTGGVQGNAASNLGGVSLDGRFVSFTSSASNLVTGDTNGVADVFLRDLAAGTTERVSLGTGGLQGNGAADNGGAVSDDGRYVSFSSVASNLVATDTNGEQDVFVRDRLAASTELVSVSSGGSQGNGDSHLTAMSGDGLQVSFHSNATNLVAGDDNATTDVFVRNRTNGSTILVSASTSGALGNDTSGGGSLDSDGRYIAFYSKASNLVAGDTNWCSFCYDVFIRDRDTDGDSILDEPGFSSVTRASVTSAGAQLTGSSAEPAITSNAAYLAFTSDAPNVVSGVTTTNRKTYIKDLQSGLVTLISVSDVDEPANGDSHNARASGNGRVVAFYSNACNLTIPNASGLTSAYDVYVRDLDGTPNTGSTDSDCDGYPLSEDNCPAVSTGWFVPVGDTDCDGFTDTSEMFVQTDETAMCATTAAPNDEGPDAWPVDFNDDQLASLSDVTAFRPVFNTVGPGPPYSARFDLNADGRITLADVTQFGPFFNKSCAP